MPKNFLALEVTPQVNRALEIFLWVAIGLFFVLSVGVRLQEALTATPMAARFSWGTVAAVSALFALAHAIYLLGWARALTFFSLNFVIAFLFEYVGVKTGLIFGRYYYTDYFGYKLLDTVPAVIPFAYFMVIYPSYIMANLIWRGRAVFFRSSRSLIFWVSVLTTLVMSAWDLTLDPAMVNEYHAWVWVDGGPYFGVPFQNYFGWLLTNLVISLAFRLTEQRLPLKPLGRITHWIVLLPLLSYAALALSAVPLGFPEATRVISPFTMGVAFVAATLKMYEPD